MKQAILKQKALVVGILILILFLFLNSEPFHFPTPLDAILVALFITLYFTFVGIVFLEKPKDEREEVHMHWAGRVSFVAGTSILSIGIATEVLKHDIDHWLVYTLITVLVSQFVARIYLHYKK